MATATIDFKELAECSEFSHLVIFKKSDLTIGSGLLHIPTKSLKYDLHFDIYDEDTIKVSLWRYLASCWCSEQKGSFLISADDYVRNISHIDDAISSGKIHRATACVWLEQSVVQDLFKYFRKFAITNEQIGFDF